MATHYIYVKHIGKKNQLEFGEWVNGIWIDKIDDAMVTNVSPGDTLVWKKWIYGNGVNASGFDSFYDLEFVIGKDSENILGKSQKKILPDKNGHLTATVNSAAKLTDLVEKYRIGYRLTSTSPVIWDDPKLKMRAKRKIKRKD